MSYNKWNTVALTSVIVPNQVGHSHSQSKSTYFMKETSIVKFANDLQNLDGKNHHFVSKNQLCTILFAYVRAKRK